MINIIQILTEEFQIRPEQVKTLLNCSMTEKLFPGQFVTGKN